jgi:hypothetical protein
MNDQHDRFFRSFGDSLARVRSTAGCEAAVTTPQKLPTLLLVAIPQQSKLCALSFTELGQLSKVFHHWNREEGHENGEMSR